MDTLMPVNTEQRSIRTAVFARYAGEKIASQRGKVSIGEVFCAVLREHDIDAGSPDRLAAWANCTSKLTLEDDLHDDEASMATRAVRLVLKQYFGETLIISGELVPGEPGTEVTETF